MDIEKIGELLKEIAQHYETLSFLFTELSEYVTYEEDEDGE